ncbi:MAG TPA: nucleotidyltransferase domain-containing protein [Pyrinomonadaceae bacterium]|nr:nucleotidyltransferase domain-containing protein [Pyrinomonadaceae bacterium]
MARLEPFEAARRVFEGRYAGARVLFLAGSVLRGEATPTSDLDVVVVYDRLPRAYREAFVSDGWPVESFVHDPETLERFIELDRQSALPSIISMVLEGVEIPGPSELSAELKRLAREAFEAGPPPLIEDEMTLLRFRLTDWLDDIRHPRSAEELVATGAYLYKDVADFFFRSRNLWTAHSKTVPRRLRQTDPEFAESFRLAFESLFAAKDPAPVIALVEGMLAPFGGLLFEGFRKEAAEK